MSPPRRKKWSETEEKTIIDKYGEMVSDGTLGKMKTREKRFRPIALYVNLMHYERDPTAYPWQWTWKDVSTKVQNMRHQYLLVKQKIKKAEVSIGDDSVSGMEEFEWGEGVSYWSNFLRYKEVFGDVALENDPGVDPDFEDGNQGPEIVVFDGDLATGIERMGYEYKGDEREENFNGSTSNHLIEDGDDGLVYEGVEGNGSSESSRRKKKALGFVASQVRQLKEMQTWFEQHEAEHESKRQKKMKEMVKETQERKKRSKRIRRQQWMEEWQGIEKESQERETRRREELLIQERDLVERMNRRRSEWTKRMDEMLNHHRAEMGQLQSRILDDQQNLVSQFVGVVSQWTAHPAALSDHTNATNHYLSQMMNNLQQHVNGMVHHDTTVEGGDQDDQFIVDS